MRVLKIIFFNILILFLLLCIFEVFLVIDNKRKAPNDKYHIGKLPYINLLRPERFRKPSGLNGTKQPIIILGCSFAYGWALKDEQTLGFKLSQYANVPVYNYAVQGKGLQNALFILQNKIYDNSIKNPQYVIYVMMSDHIRRLYTNVCMGDFVGYPIYKIDKYDNLTLKYDYFPFYRQFYTFYFFNNLIFNNLLYKDYKRHNRYVNAYFLQMNKEIKKQYPNIKFVILIFGDKNNFGLDLSKLEKNGFIILQTQEITGINFFNSRYQLSSTDPHPTEEVWNIIAPALADKLNL